ncbi:peroxiredoxin (alkyl hydroperoxide reductase subunit C) [Nematocida displodere]|uniref:Peroxiredoxin (Alkyl hydroperoxide reductase subunit C) n=1 Tax=Nematocida displodere TaxID=1805483 RepID=A0A177EC33_9MICR|nr:peroxiredoxin (alkyl hydroperoxide reductase subunit C) [Nematocida displodere]
MTLIGQSIGEFKLQAYVDGKIVEIDLSAYGKKTVVLVFYPLDFTFVCPTEIIGFSKCRKSFEEEGTDILLISCDSVYSHKAWAEMKNGGIFENTLPLLSDKSGQLSRHLGIYLEEEGFSHRATIIAQDGVVVYEVIHADPIGRSSRETLRVVKALKFNQKNGAVCPFEWDGQ